MMIIIWNGIFTFFMWFILRFSFHLLLIEFTAFLSFSTVFSFPPSSAQSPLESNSQCMATKQTKLFSLSLFSHFHYRSRCSLPDYQQQKRKTKLYYGKKTILYVTLETGLFVGCQQQIKSKCMKLRKKVREREWENYCSYINRFCLFLITC